MTYPFATPTGDDHRMSEFRRTHFRAYDDGGFLGAFSRDPPENASVESVTGYLSSRFSDGDGTGFDSKDIVVFLGSRIVAVVRKGSDGGPEVTVYPP